MGNTLTLHKTGLIEAFNLKAAIEYLLKNPEAAREALTDMPPRGENELDAVTLHNQAFFIFCMFCMFCIFCISYPINQQGSIHSFFNMVVASSFNKFVIQSVS